MDGKMRMRLSRKDAKTQWGSQTEWNRIDS